MKPIRPGRTLVGFAFPLLLLLGSSHAADYTQTFTAADGATNLGDGSVIRGNLAFTPSVQGNRLQLTSNTTNNNSAFHIPAVAGSSTGWAATFDFTITDNTANPPAEGFSFSYGDIPFGLNSSRGEEGWPGRTNLLSFEIDIALNGDNEVGPAIGFNRPTTIGSLGGSTHSSSLAFTNGDILPDNGTVSGTATIAWAPGFGTSFRTTGLGTNADFGFVFTPDFVADDAHTFALAGRTSGATAEVTIDNISICVGTADSDGDGLPDVWEILGGLDPNSAAGDNGASGDPDGDGLTNLEEFNRRTNPTNPDTDGDGLPDNVETATGTWVSPSDTGTSPIDPDSDGDGLPDGVETNTGIFVNPSDTGSNPNLANTDGDSLDDGEEVALGGRNPNVADDPNPDSVYVQDFSGFSNGTVDLMDGTTIVGNAAVFNGALRMTTNANDQNSAFHIPARVGSSNGWTISFDYSIMDNTDNPPADGFAFSYGALPPGGLGAPAEEGFPGTSPCLSFEMDTWFNGDAEVGPAIGVDRPAGIPGLSLHPSSVAFINGNILPDGTPAAPSMVSGTIDISVLPNGLASFVSTGAVTNADFRGVITNFVLDDDHTFAFTARTGGANEEVTIDNIRLVTGLPDSDGDGLFDVFELEHGLDPYSAIGDDGPDGDPDGDGLSNLDEQSIGSNPNLPDTDGDGLLDRVETGTGVWVSPSDTGTSPTNPDSDGDGLPDGVETNTGIFVSYDPVTKTGDTGTDPNNPNTDGDNAPDGAEVIVGRDPNVPDDPPPSRNYQQDFDSYPDGTRDLGDGSTIGSTNNTSAQVLGQQLRLTQTGVGGTHSSFRIPALVGSSGGFTATFDFTLHRPTGVPADGFSFCYGAIPPRTLNDASAAGNGAAEEGWPGVEQLCFEFDTYDNAAGEAGLGIAALVGGSPIDPAFSPGLFLAPGPPLTGSATISWNPESGASFSTSGLGAFDVDFQDVAIPGFVGNDDFIFAFTARTGGETEDLFIDNLEIVTGSQPFRFDIVGAGNALVLTWDSKAGRVYDVVTNTTLDAAIATWDILLADIPTTAPENVETIPRPADPTRFYAIIEKEAPALFAEDFESGQGNWLTGVTDAFGETEWEIGPPTGAFVGPISGADGSANCAGTNLAGEYGANSDVFLRSPVIDLTAPGIAGATLTMHLFIDTDLVSPPPEPDHGILRVIRASDDTQLGAEIPYPNSTSGDFEGISTDWESFTAPLPPQAVGQMIRLEFQFLTNDNGSQWGGWYIDNVEVKLE